MHGAGRSRGESSSMTTVTERLEALRSLDRQSYGSELIRIRRQIAMLTEHERKPMAMPAQKRRVG